MRLLFLFLFIVSSVSAQNFELKQFDLAVLVAEPHASSEDTDMLYMYLKSNYARGVKKNIQFYYGNKENGICGFVQSFENGVITYTKNECAEEGGFENSLTLPKVNLDQLRNLIEDLEAAGKNDLPMKWTANKTKYIPKDEEAGCYYEIISKTYSTLVKILCGC
ncbi:hypothetical protein KH5_17840 [Urechidicola sp. KH5]